MKSTIKIALALSLFCSAALAGDIDNGGLAWNEENGTKVCGQKSSADNTGQSTCERSTEGDIDNGGRAAVAVIISEYFAGLF